MQARVAFRETRCNAGLLRGVDARARAGVTSGLRNRPFRSAFRLALAAATGARVVPMTMLDHGLASTDVAVAKQPRRRRKRGKKAPRFAFDRRTRVGQKAVKLAAAFRER